MIPLVLGTAQLGLDYGIANITGKPDASRAEAIVQTALDCGITTFDTAQAYGDSETVLGRALKSLGHGGDLRIISKLAPHLDPRDGKALRAAVEASLRRLGVAALSGLMLHRASWLAFWDEGLREILEGMRHAGLFQKIGVSVYTADEARLALSLPGIAMIQLPMNILDQAPAREGLVERARGKGVELYLRSIYLQGLLLLPVEKLPERPAGVAPHLIALDALCRSLGLGRELAAIAYVFHRSQGMPLVIGAETPAQVAANCRLLAEAQALSAESVQTLICQAEERLWVHDPRIINPSLWGGAS